MKVAMAIRADRLALLPSISLKSGEHASFERGACAMEAASWLVGDVWTDHPECVCPVLGALMRAWNDALPSDDERTRFLRPLIPTLIGTSGGALLERRRAAMAADWLVRVHTPAWLRLATLDKQADDLADLPEITDVRQLQALLPTLASVRRDSDAASAAAWDAAWDAASAAARAALSTTKEELQWSAVYLVRRMAAVS